MSKHPHYGHTKSGMPVHLRTQDHRKGGANKRIGLAITTAVGSMPAAYVFTVLALVSLPAILVQAFPHMRGTFPSWLINASLIALVAWVAQTFLQLVLLPVIIVGQNAQAEASDARAAKTFEDTELLVDRLDTRTQGGLTDVLNEVRGAREDFGKVMDTLRSLLAATPPPAPAPAPAQAAVPAPPFVAKTATRSRAKPGGGL